MSNWKSVRKLEIVRWLRKQGKTRREIMSNKLWQTKANARRTSFVNLDLSEITQRPQLKDASAVEKKSFTTKEKNVELTIVNIWRTIKGILFSLMAKLKDYFYRFTGQSH